MLNGLFVCKSCGEGKSPSELASEIYAYFQSKDWEQACDLLGPDALTDFTCIYCGAEVGQSEVARVIENLNRCGCSTFPQSPVEAARSFIQNTGELDRCPSCWRYMPTEDVADTRIDLAFPL